MRGKRNYEDFEKAQRCIIYQRAEVSRFNAHTRLLLLLISVYISRVSFAEFYFFAQKGAIIYEVAAVKKKENRSPGKLVAAFEGLSLCHIVKIHGTAR